MRGLLTGNKISRALVLGTGLLISGGAFSVSCTQKLDEYKTTVDPDTLTLNTERIQYSCTEAIIRPAVPAVKRLIVIAAAKPAVTKVVEVTPAVPAVTEEKEITPAIPAVTEAKYSSTSSTTKSPLKFTGQRIKGPSELCLIFGTAPNTAEKCHTLPKLDQPIAASDAKRSRLVACVKPTVCTPQRFALNNQSIEVQYKWDGNYLGTSDPNVMGPNGKCGCVPNLK